MKKELRGQTALITGGSRGIGFGIARSLLVQGLNVAITGRDDSALAEAKRRLGAAGQGRVETLAVDVRDYEAIAQAVDRIIGVFGGLDVVVNNAGIGRFVNIADMTPEQWSEIIDTNVTGVFNVCHATLPALRKRGGGYIINISSLAGKNPFVGAGAYCASKAALNQFSEVLNQEVRHDDIKVTNIAPGSVATRFADGDEEHGADWKIATSDIGDLVVDLLQLDRRTLPSYIELRPSKPPKK
jgi:NAD(P)-dependent dehydrogenase (short-subunit alcohol dehydrogenase family)